MLKSMVRLARTVVQLTHDGTAVYNVRTKAGSPAGVVDVVLTVPNGVYPTGGAGVAAIDWGTGWTAGSTFTLVNRSVIPGPGGDGGNGRGSDVSVGWDGSPGGFAMRLRGLTVSIDNGSGYIFGGGGGGAGSCGTGDHDTSREMGGCGGGGGQGWVSPYNGGTGGAGYNTLQGNDGENGSNGTPDGPGAGGGGGHLGKPKAGDGGGWGEAGGSVGGAAGGAAGKAIQLDGGSVIWISGNNTSQVKGAVS